MESETFPRLTDVQIAYLAGLFEGEGSIENRPGRGFCVNLGMCDEDVIRKASEMVGVGHLRVAQVLPSGRLFFVWRISRARDAIHFLRLILPFLGERRTSRAIEMMAKWDAAPLPPKESPTCKNGHPFSGDNLRMDGTWRKCKTCDRERMRPARSKSATVGTAGGYGHRSLITSPRTHGPHHPPLPSIHRQDARQPRPPPLPAQPP